MANVRKQSIDKTHLALDNAADRLFIHRDYLAHCLRWDYVANKYIRRLVAKHEDVSVLDVGCGKDLPLARCLYTNRIFPARYVGCDVNKLELGPILEKAAAIKDRITLLEKCDFAEGNVVTDVDQDGVVHIDYKTTGYGDQFIMKFDVITSLEVLEHVEPDHAVRLIQKMKQHLKPDGVIFISTPCYSEAKGAAANHVNEMKRDALGYVFEREGLMVVGNWGTFGDSRIVQAACEAEGMSPRIMEALKAWHGTETFANLFAPAFPELARNNFWMLKHSDQLPADWARKFPVPGDAPWTSSEKWQELCPEVQVTSTPGALLPGEEDEEGLQRAENL